MVDKYQEKGPRLQARHSDSKTISRFVLCEEHLGITELAVIDVNSLPQQNALFYVGGYVCKKYLAKHICKECTSSLTCSELSDLSDSSTTFWEVRSRHAWFSVSVVPKKNVKTFLCPTSRA